VESAADGTLLLRDEAHNGTLLRPGQPSAPLSGTNDFWGIAISADGRHLATSRWNEPNVLFFDAAAQRAGKFATELCTQPVFSPDGRRLFAVDQDAICAWDTTTQKPLWRTARDRAQMGAGWCAVSPDSRWLAATLDEAPALLDAATGTVRLRLTTPGNARADRFAWSPDGRQLAARLVRGGLVVWQTGALLDVLHEHGALRDVTPGPQAP
jgi:WD40 repeat protein